MIRVFIHNWWLFALRGVFAALFAVFAFSLRTAMGAWLISEIAAAGLVVLFGLLAIAAGLCTVGAAVRGAGQDREHLLLWDGITICIAGGVILLAPRLDLTWLVHTVAVLALVIGTLEILMARRLWRHIPDGWILALAGAVSFGFGACFLIVRDMESASMLRWLGVYAGFSALAILSLALRLHSFQTSVHHLAQHAVTPAPK